jgi:oligo-1,6-glucosidase
VDEDRRELQTFFHFEVAGWGLRKDDFMYPDSANRHLPDLKAVFNKWDEVFEHKGWGTVYLGNHGQSRMVSRYGNDTPLPVIQVGDYRPGRQNLMDVPDVA